MITYVITSGNTVSYVRLSFTRSEARELTGAQRYQANGSHCEAMAVLTCPKPIPKVYLVPRPKRNTAFVGFSENNQGECNTSKEMLKSLRVEEWNKISIDETTKLIKSLPNMLRKL
ncbi:hypothetical protein TNCV_4825971 [Trichonephila clavipes]|uniref:Uncharacterized protein n=1 Tax=Trichonephila clavipes TaxID=2585209 RepID=A0A8X6V5C7_TRICX|nr:hypothetical protein TNCV_4825971 [Trichonephila clavipes]